MQRLTERQSYSLTGHPKPCPIQPCYWGLAPGRGGIPSWSSHLVLKAGRPTAAAQAPGLGPGLSPSTSQGDQGPPAAFPPRTTESLSHQSLLTLEENQVSSYNTNTSPPPHPCPRLREAHKSSSKNLFLRGLLGPECPCGQALVGIPKGAPRRPAPCVAPLGVWEGRSGPDQGVVLED